MIVDFDWVGGPHQAPEPGTPFLEIMEIEQEFDAMRKQEAEGTLRRGAPVTMLSLGLKDLVRVVLLGSRGRRAGA